MSMYKNEVKAGNIADVEFDTHGLSVTCKTTMADRNGYSFPGALSFYSRMEFVRIRFRRIAGPAWVFWERRIQLP